MPELDRRHWREVIACSSPHLTQPGYLSQSGVRSRLQHQPDRVATHVRLWRNHRDPMKDVDLAITQGAEQSGNQRDDDQETVIPRRSRRDRRKRRVEADIAVEQPGGPDIDAVVEQDGRFLVHRVEMHFLEIAAADEIEFGDVEFVGHVALLLPKKGGFPWWAQK